MNDRRGSAAVAMALVLATLLLVSAVSVGSQTESPSDSGLSPDQNVEIAETGVKDAMSTTGSSTAATESTASDCVPGPAEEASDRAKERAANAGGLDKDHDRPEGHQGGGFAAPAGCASGAVGPIENSPVLSRMEHSEVVKRNLRSMVESVAAQQASTSEATTVRPAENTLVEGTLVRLEAATNTYVEEYNEVVSETVWSYEKKEVSADPYWTYQELEFDVYYTFEELQSSSYYTFEKRDVEVDRDVYYTYQKAVESTEEVRVYETEVRDRVKKVGTYWTYEKRTSRGYSHTHTEEEEYTHCHSRVIGRCIYWESHTRTIEDDHWHSADWDSRTTYSGRPSGSDVRNVRSHSYTYYETEWVPGPDIESRHTPSGMRIVGSHTETRTATDWVPRTSSTRPYGSDVRNVQRHVDRDTEVTWKPDRSTTRPDDSRSDIRNVQHHDREWWEPETSETRPDESRSDIRNVEQETDSHWEDRSSETEPDESDPTIRNVDHYPNEDVTWVEETADEKPDESRDDVRNVQQESERKTVTRTREFEVAGQEFAPEGSMVLASDVGEVRDARLTVIRRTLPESRADALTIRATENGASLADDPVEWELRAWNDSGTIVVEDSTGTRATADAKTATVDFAADEFDFAPGLTDYDVVIRNGDGTYGTLTMVTRGGEAYSPHFTTSDVVFEVAFDITYQTTRTTYTDRTMVQPEYSPQFDTAAFEPGGGGASTLAATGPVDVSPSLNLAGGDVP